MFHEMGNGAEHFHLCVVFCFKIYFSYVSMRVFITLFSDPFSSLFSFPPMTLHTHTHCHDTLNQKLVVSKRTALVLFLRQPLRRRNCFTVVPDVSRLLSNRFPISGKVNLFARIRSSCSQRGWHSEYSETHVPWRLLGGMLTRFHERPENQRNSQRHEECYGGS